MTNDQIHNETHHVTAKESSLTGTNNEELQTKPEHLQSIVDKNFSVRASNDVSSEDYEKTIGQQSTVKRNENCINEPIIISPLDNTNESTQSENIQNDLTSSEFITNQHHNKLSIKTKHKTRQNTDQNHFPNDNTRQRSSSSSSTDSSKSNDNQTSNIPYETLYNDEDDDDDDDDNQPAHTNKTTSQVSS